MNIRRFSGFARPALAAACSGAPTVDATTDTGDEPSSTTDATTGEPEPEPEPEPMVPPRPEVQRCRFDGQAPGVQPPLAEVPMFAEASLDEVVDVAPAGPDHVLVAERGGRILAGNVDAGVLAPVADFLKDRGRIVALAPAPDFLTSGHLFVRLEASVPARAVVLRLTVDLATWTADPASERVVIQIGDAVGERSGGALTFDASGMLIIGVGDLGEQVLPAASDPTDVRGKLLRIDVGPLEDNGTYAIPADNPFVGEGGDADEVWAVGLRDPWRCTPAEAGALWCVDVGESEHEVDLVTAGADLGWPHIEAGTCRLPGGDCSGLNADWPAATYRGGDGDCGPAGALFGVSPGLGTSLVYADRCSGRLRGVDTADPGVVVQEELLAAEPAGIRSNAMIMKAMLLSGAIAGLVALQDVIGIDDRMKLDYIRGYGFTGIAIALLGRNSGLGIVAGALLFSFLDRASSGIGLNTDVPKEVTTIMQGVIILTIVIAYEVVRRMTARRQLREQHDRA